VKDLMNRQVSRELGKLTKIGQIARPPSGWIRSIREALGMTTSQLAKKLGVIQQRVSTIEDAERRGALKISSLEQVASALNCRLVYFLIPAEPLEKMLEQRARIVAKRRLDLSTHSMDLEDQAVSDEEKRRQFEELVKELLMKRPKELWDEE
jgi:predicted DNA-binding mobile mystery protein A